MVYLYSTIKMMHGPINIRFYEELDIHVKRRLCKRANLSIMAPVGEHRRGSFSRTFERKLEMEQLFKINMGSILDPDYVRSLVLGGNVEVL